jgi:hypothetical protein
VPSDATAGRFALTTLFTLAQRPRSELCLTGMPPISHIPDYEGERPPGSTRINPHRRVAAVRVSAASSVQRFSSIKVYSRSLARPPEGLTLSSRPRINLRIQSAAALMKSPSAERRRGHADATNPCRQQARQAVMRSAVSPVADRRPPEGPLFQALPQQHQAGPVPRQDLQTVRSLRTENEDRSTKWILSQSLTH